MSKNSLKLTLLITTLLLTSQIKGATTTKTTQYVGKNGYLKAEWFEVDTKSTDSYIFIKLKHLEDMFPSSRQTYVSNLVNRHRHNIVRIEPKDSEIVLRKLFTYTPHDNLYMFSKGIIPIKIDNIYSYEGLDLRVGVKTDYNVRRTLAQVHDTGIPGGITSSDLRRILTDENSHEVYWNGNWVQFFDISGIFTFVGYIMRGFIIVIQFFLTFVRPCTAKKDTKYYHWGISFTSTMFHLQLFLLYGLVAENFGGPLNTAMEKLLVTSRTRFFGYFNSETARWLDDEFEDVGYWKLVEAKYVASPIYENYVGLFLLIFSIVLCHWLSGAKGSGSNSMAKKFRVGCSLAFMIPLSVSAVNCVYAVFTGAILSIGSFFSIAASIFIFIYYLMFGFEIMGSHQKTKYYKSSYTHINFDFLPGFTEKPIRNYEFFCMWILTIFFVFGINFQIVPIATAAILYVCMMIMDFATPRKERIREKFLYLKRIHALKVALFALRAVFFGILFLFILFRRKVSSLGIKTITLLAYIGLIIDALFNWAMFMFRIAGLWNDGFKKRVEGYEGDQDGPYVELNESNQQAVDAAKTYAKYGGVL